MTDHIEEPNKLTVGDRDEGDEALATRIVEVLRGLPQDHTIYWNDPPAEDGMYHTFVDIWAPIVCEPLEIGWAWTIADDKKDPSLQSLTLIVKPDVIVDGQPAWRASTINRTLEAWTTQHAQRTDLRFASDSGLVPPLVRYLMEAQDHKRPADGLEFEGYRYLRLDRVDQVERHQGSAAFQRFLSVSRDPTSVGVRVAGQPIEVDGGVLVWGAADPRALGDVSQCFRFADILTVESIVRDLHRWQPPEWKARVAGLRSWSGELFDWLDGDLPDR